MLGAVDAALHASARHADLVNQVAVLRDKRMV
jgi:hypothetical protein